ncbi:hypothetical protein D4764_03G0000250 [Takifugu flavidus]|uniref:Ubiquitin-like domain-containing protein n=1 Tax=Takifugu flavidus TaxID=433684 RepID=A0A5C6NBI5_9TELE|nr:hypothetical protein D4764_03G0000250 [Takifugu flavidus]
MAVTIFIESLNGNIYEITFSDDENPFETATVADLKDRLYRISGIPVEQMRITYGGARLADDRLLSEYGIQHESTVDLILKIREGGVEESIGNIWRCRQAHLWAISIRPPI